MKMRTLNYCWSPHHCSAPNSCSCHHSWAAAVTGPAFSSKLDLRLEFRRLSKVSPSDNLLFVRRENFRVFEHHLKYIPSPTLCWYWQFYVENIQTEYYHHFGIFNFSTLNFVLDENPIFCGCQFDGPKVKNWQNYIAVILALSWTWKSPVIFVLIEKCSSKEWNLLTNCHHK